MRLRPTRRVGLETRSEYAAGLMWLPWKAALALAVALAIVPFLVVFGLFARPKQPGVAVRAVVRPGDRGRTRAVRAVAVRGHALAPPGQRRRRPRPLDLPLRAAAAPPERALGAAPRAEVVAAHAGAERLLRDGALPRDDRVPHLDVHPPPRPLPAGPQHRRDRHRRRARDPAHPGRAAPPHARASGSSTRRRSSTSRCTPRSGTPGPDQLSAMPSVHVAWAVLVALGVILFSTSRWRWLILAHPVPHGARRGRDRQPLVARRHRRGAAHRPRDRGRAVAARRLGRRGPARACRARSAANVSRRRYLQQPSM